ncbi:SDR family NAD-dependent epimerase/dehydratase, partial [Verrucomicrobiota bacterium]
WSVEKTALTVKDVLGDDRVTLEYVPTDDMRSYHINSDRVHDVLGFEPKHTVEQAISSIAEAYRVGRLSDPMNNSVYYNVRRMKELALG